MKVEYTRRALADLEDIAEYFARSDQPEVGRHIADAITRLWLGSNSFRTAAVR